MPVYRLVVPLPVSCGEEFLFIPSSPALRVAACGGRPRAGNDTTGTGEPSGSQRSPYGSIRDESSTANGGL
jgi:hypothetical protein